MTEAERILRKIIILQDDREETIYYKIYDKEVKAIETVLNMLEGAREYIKTSKSRTSYDNMQTWKKELFLDDERCKYLLKILGG